jgi:hypothetical protein
MLTIQQKLFTLRAQILVRFNTINTILTRHPDAYLYGSLAAAGVYLMDDQKTTLYEQLFTRAIR